MQEFLLETNEIVFETELRNRYSNISFPLAIDQESLNSINAFIIKPVTKPSVTYSQLVFRNGVENINGEYFQRWSVFNLTSQEVINKLNEDKKLYLTQINHDDNKIYADVIGNKTTEYLKAAEDARAYKAAGYPEEAVPDYVQSWADAKLWTARQACDDIILQEMMWQGAAKLIRDYRLKAKEAVKRATTIEEVETAMLTWNGFVFNIRTQLGVN